MTDSTRKARCVEQEICCSCSNPLHDRNLGIAVFLRQDGSEHAICGDCKVPPRSHDCEHMKHPGFVILDALGPGGQQGAMLTVALLCATNDDGILAPEDAMRICADWKISVTIEQATLIAQYISED